MKQKIDAQTHPGLRHTKVLVYLTANQAEALRTRAYTDRLSKSEIVRQALDSYIGTR